MLCSRCLSVRWKVDWISAEAGEEKKCENNIHPNLRSSAKCLRQQRVLERIMAGNERERVSIMQSRRLHQCLSPHRLPFLLPHVLTLPQRHSIPLRSCPSFKFNICLSIFHLIIKCERTLSFYLYMTMEVDLVDVRIGRGSVGWWLHPERRHPSKYSIEQWVGISIINNNLRTIFTLDNVSVAHTSTKNTSTKQTQFAIHTHLKRLICRKTVGGCVCDTKHY